MRKLLRNSVDLVLTDPPSLTSEQLTNFVKELYRLNPKNIVVTTPKSSHRLEKALGKYFKYEAMIRIDAKIEEKIIYWTKILWFSNGGKYYGKYQDHIDEKAITGKRLHPAQRIVASFKTLCKMFSEKHHTVLDPFMGSGTTGIACKELGRNFIGIEYNKKYFKKANERINNNE
jgi:DNA modification methylase